MVDSPTNTTPTRLTGGQALVAQLVREGVTHVFGLPGDQTMHALDAFYDEPSIQFVTTRHEQGTTYLADGYARGGGRPGVAFVVPGVGLYNAGAGLATAFASSSPVVLIAGQVNRAGIGQHLGLLHEIDDQLDLVRPDHRVAAPGPARARDPRDRARGVRARASGAAGNRWRSRCRRRRSPTRPTSRCARRPRASRDAADPDEIARAADVLGGADATRDLVGRWCGPRRRHRRARRAGRVPAGRRWSPPVRARAASTPATRSTRAPRG